MAFDPHDEYRAALALRHTPGIGTITARRLVAQYGSLTAACAAAPRWVEDRMARSAQAAAFAAKKWRKRAQEEYDAVRKAGHRYLTMTDEHYPELLRATDDPPLILYWAGERNLLAGPCVAIVGARRCSRYGLDITRSIGEELSRAGITIVSGLADGIDRQAHYAGLSGVGSSVAVLGTGLDRVYPERNADLWRTLTRKGLVITEFAPGTLPEAHNFPARNRIISGLSLAVLVAEAPARSGALITARKAMEQGREVFAMPGPVGGFDGCIRLIREGAAAVGCADDILQELSWVLRKEAGVEIDPSAFESPPPPKPAPEQAAPPAWGPAERSLLDALPEDGERIHVDSLVRRLDLPVAEVSRLLLDLELEGAVRQWPGMYYSREVA